MYTSRHHHDSRRAPVLLVKPDIELAWSDWGSRVTLRVADLVLADPLPAYFRVERVANERRPGGLACSAHLIDELQELLINGHLDCLHSMWSLIWMMINIIYHIEGRAGVLRESVVLSHASLGQSQQAPLGK